MGSHTLIPLQFADELAVVFARLSGLLLTEETVQTSLSLVARLAHETMSDSVGAGVTLVAQGGQKKTAAFTDEIVARLDELQYELDEGPCLAAYTDRTPVMVGDTGTDRRFPAWSRAARRLGVAATVSVPLVAGDDCVGSMKVYSSVERSFDVRAQTKLSLLADQAAVVLANAQAYERAARMSEQLREAMLSRDAINTAKGILMAQDSLAEHEALQSLMRMTTGDSEKLADVAHALIVRVNRRNRSTPWR